MMKVYGYMKCDTCRKALKWLDARGVSYTFVDITQTPPAAKVLQAALKAGYPLKKLFNTSGRAYRAGGVKDKLASMTEAEAVKLLVSDGMLCKRPVAVDGERVTVGFDAAKFEEVWG